MLLSSVTEKIQDFFFRQKQLESSCLIRREARTDVFLYHTRIVLKADNILNTKSVG